LSSEPVDIPQFMQVGMLQSIGSFIFTEAEIIEFAKQFDPQIFHLDPIAAKDTLLGGHCASGWQTSSVWMKLQRKFIEDKVKSLKVAKLPYPEFGPSPGMKDMKWLQPVFADDTISYSNEVLQIRKSNSRKGWWLSTSRHMGHNQNGDCVFEFESSVLVTFKQDT